LRPEDTEPGWARGARNESSLFTLTPSARCGEERKQREGGKEKKITNGALGIGGLVLHQRLSGKNQPKKKEQPVDRVRSCPKNRNTNAQDQERVTGGLGELVKGNGGGGLYS